MAKNRLDDIMKEQGRTRKWLARMVGIHYNVICSYCNNKTQPNLTKMAKISQHLGISINDLLEK